jgi:hypothetical protein
MFVSWLIIMLKVFQLLNNVSHITSQTKLLLIFVYIYDYNHDYY